jgi:hypothetical protein
MFSSAKAIDFRTMLAASAWTEFVTLCQFESVKLAATAMQSSVNPNEVAVTTLPTLWWRFVIAALLLGITVLGIMFVFFLFDALRRTTDPTPETSPRHVLVAVLLTLGALLGGVLIGLLVPVSWLERLL